MNRAMRIAILGIGASLFAGTARAADSPDTAVILNKLHNSNLTAIEAGKLAQDNGRSKATRDYGKMLVADQTTADQQVMALAKEEGIDVAAGAPVVGSKSVADLTAGRTFDHRFARSMIDDDKKEIAELAAARGHTTDAKLEKLLADLLPTLQDHLIKAENLEKAR